jgi:integrase
MFKRMPLLSPEVEVKLAEEMLPLWGQGLKAKEIADELNFGRGDYAKLKTFHVWFYRLKFNDARYEHLKDFKGQFQRRKRGIAKGKSRYKEKFDETMPFSEFKSLLNRNVSKSDDDEVMMKRALCILFYWTPLRRSEILERVRKDFKVKRDYLVINLYRKKKSYLPTAKPEPFYLLLELPLVDEVVEWIEKFKSNERPFDITPLKAWYWVKDVFEGRYVHFFRYNFITKAVENSEDARTILAELLDDTRMDITTVTGYVMASPKHRAAISRRELKTLRREHA